MISAWWLLLICPACAMIGFFTAALLSMSDMEYRKGGGHNAPDKND